MEEKKYKEQKELTDEEFDQELEDFGKRMYWLEKAYRQVEQAEADGTLESAKCWYLSYDLFQLLYPIISPESKDGVHQMWFLPIEVIKDKKETLKLIIEVN